MTVMHIITPLEGAPSEAVIQSGSTEQPPGELSDPTLHRRRRGGTLEPLKIVKSMKKQREDRINPRIKVTDPKFKKVERFFGRLLRSSRWTLDQILRHHFTEHEVAKFYPSSEKSMMKWQQEDAIAYAQFVRANCEPIKKLPVLEFKLALLFFGLPIAPMKMGRNQAFGPQDLETYMEDLPLRMLPLSFLDKFEERTWGKNQSFTGRYVFPIQKPVLSQSMNLRGGGLDDDDDDLEDVSDYSETSSSEAEQGSRPDEYHIFGYQGRVTFSNLDEEAFANALEHLLSLRGNVEGEVQICVDIFEGGRCIKTRDDSIEYSKREGVCMSRQISDFVIFNMVEAYDLNLDDPHSPNPEARRDAFVRFMEDPRPQPFGSPTVNHRHAVVSAQRKFLKEPKFVTDKAKKQPEFWNRWVSAYLRLPNEPSEHHVPSQYAVEWRKTMRVLFPDGLHAYISPSWRLEPNDGNVEKMYPEEDPTSELVHEIVRASEQTFEPEIRISQVEQIGSGTLSVIIPGEGERGKDGFKHKETREITKDKLSNLDLLLQIVKDGCKPGVIKNIELWLPAQDFHLSERAHNCTTIPLYDGELGPEAIMTWVQSINWFRDHYSAIYKRGFAIVVRPVYETYTCRRHERHGEAKAVEVDLMQLSLADFKKDVVKELFGHDYAKGGKHVIRMKAQGFGTEQLIFQNTENSEWTRYKLRINSDQVVIDLVRQTDHDEYIDGRSFIKEVGWDVDPNSDFGPSYFDLRGTDALEDATMEGALAPGTNPPEPKSKRQKPQAPVSKPVMPETFVSRATPAQATIPTTPASQSESEKFEIPVSNKPDPKPQPQKPISRLDQLFSADYHRMDGEANHVGQRNISFWHPDTIFANPLKPAMPVHGPPIESMLYTGPNVPQISMAIRTPTEIARLEREVHILRGTLLDRVRECPYKGCNKLFHYNDPDDMDYHLNKEHSVLRCAMCSTINGIETKFQLMNKEELEKHMVTMHWEYLQQFVNVRDTQTEAASPTVEAEEVGDTTAPIVLLPTQVLFNFCDRCGRNQRLCHEQEDLKNHQKVCLHLDNGKERPDLKTGENACGMCDLSLSDFSNAYKARHGEGCRPVCGNTWDFCSFCGISLRGLDHYGKRHHGAACEQRPRPQPALCPQCPVGNARTLYVPEEVLEHSVQTHDPQCSHCPWCNQSFGRNGRARLPEEKIDHFTRHMNPVVLGSSDDEYEGVPAKCPCHGECGVATDNMSVFQFEEHLRTQHWKSLGATGPLPARPFLPNGRENPLAMGSDPGAALRAARARQEPTAIGSHASGADRKRTQKPYDRPVAVPKSAKPKASTKVKKVAKRSVVAPQKPSKEETAVLSHRRSTAGKKRRRRRSSDDGSDYEDSGAEDDDAEGGKKKRKKSGSSKKRHRKRRQGEDGSEFEFSGSSDSEDYSEYETESEGGTKRKKRRRRRRHGDSDGEYQYSGSESSELVSVSSTSSSDAAGGEPENSDEGEGPGEGGASGNGGKKRKRDKYHGSRTSDGAFRKPRGKDEADPVYEYGEGDAVKDLGPDQEAPSSPIKKRKTGSKKGARAMGSQAKIEKETGTPTTSSGKKDATKKTPTSKVKTGSGKNPSAMSAEMITAKQLAKQAALSGLGRRGLAVQAQTAQAAPALEAPPQALPIPTSQGQQREEQPPQGPPVTRVPGATEAPAATVTRSGRATRPTQAAREAAEGASVSPEQSKEK